MVIMHCLAHPLVQIVDMPRLLQSTSREKKKKDLPDDCAERVNITLLPNPNAESLKKEPKSSPTKLLVGIVYYCIQKNFGGSCTQTHVVTKFGLKPKIIVLCIMRKKYFSGTDKKVAIKHKAAEKKQQTTDDTDNTEGQQL